MRWLLIAALVLGCEPGLAHFSADGISFDYPGSWHAYRDLIGNTTTTRLVVLSNADLGSCLADQECDAGRLLPPGGVMITVDTVGDLFRHLPVDGQPTEIGGHPGWVQEHHLGDYTGLTWGTGQYRVEAIVRGDAARAQAMQLARTVRIAP